MNYYVEIKELLLVCLGRKKGDSSLHLKKEVVNSFILQFLINVAGLFVLPLSLSYFVDDKRYGFFTYASQMLVYLSNMNFGMGFGMQNKVTEAMTHGEVEKARSYISVAYKYTFVVGVSMLFIGIVIGNYIDWNQFFNNSVGAGTSKVDVVELRNLALATFGTFCISFMFGNINQLLVAMHKTSLTKMIGLANNLLTLGSLVGIMFLPRGILFIGALALTIPMVITNIAANIIFFKKFPQLTPSLKYVSSESFNAIVPISGKFFALQLTSLLIVSTAIPLITHLINPDAVVPYSVLLRYFTFPLSLFSLALAPMWPAITRAYAGNDYDWIHRNIRKMFLLATIASAATIIFGLLSVYLIPLWVDNRVQPQHFMGTVWLFILSTCINYFTAIISTYLNATSKLGYQFWIQIIYALIVIVLTYVLIHQFNWGIAGAVAASLAGISFYLIACGKYMWTNLQSLHHSQ